jgi:hypothetical protein
MTGVLAAGNAVRWAAGVWVFDPAVEHAWGTNAGLPLPGVASMAGGGGESWAEEPSGGALVCVLLLLPALAFRLAALSAAAEATLFSGGAVTAAAAATVALEAVEEAAGDVGAAAGGLGSPRLSAIPVAVTGELLMGLDTAGGGVLTER